MKQQLQTDVNEIAVPDLQRPNAPLFPAPPPVENEMDQAGDRSAKTHHAHVSELESEGSFVVGGLTSQTISSTTTPAEVYVTSVKDSSSQTKRKTANRLLLHGTLEVPLIARESSKSAV